MSSQLTSRLEAVTGLTSSEGEPLAMHTTFRIGGPAELFVRVSTEAALSELLVVARESGEELQLLGLGSNVLVPDCGLQGIVALLEGTFLDTKIRGELVEAGAGLPLARLARRTLEEGLVGLEALAGFPSTVGGAVYMNAGCYGVEINELLQSLIVFDRDGERHVLEPEALASGYRSTSLQGSGAIIVRVTIKLRQGDTGRAIARMEELNRQRWESLPSGKANAGSVFRNPPGDFAGRLIEACGLKGRRCGDAEISARHANVIVNHGEARATEVLELMLLARQAVSERFGVKLEPEIVLMGDLVQQWREALAVEPPG